MYYNTEYKLTYFENDSDTLYRKELLDVFNLKDVDSFDELEKTQNILFNKFKDNILFNEIIKHSKITLQKKIPFELSNNTIFCFLFSFDYFYLVHNIIGDLSNTDNISKNNFDLIINKLKKNI